jgi:short subunit dehydrogenase-like uncharacterized protein
VNAGLDDDTDDEDDACKHNDKLAAKLVRKDTIGQDTNPSTKLKNRGQETSEGGVANTIGARDAAEAVHGKYLPEHALVVAVHEATHRSAQRSVTVGNIQQHRVRTRTRRWRMCGHWQ